MARRKKDSWTKADEKKWKLQCAKLRKRVHKAVEACFGNDVGFELLEGSNLAYSILAMTKDVSWLK